MTGINAAPRAAVKTPAVPAEKAPPTTLPAPGTHLIKLTTMNLPKNVPPTQPAVMNRKDDIKVQGTFTPYAAAIPESIPNSSGAIKKQSENGIGTPPQTAVPAVHEATIAADIAL